MIRSAAPITLALLITVVVRPGAQTPSPTFEVASIKVNKVGGGKSRGPASPASIGMGGVLTPQGDRLRAPNVTLRTLLRYAYGQENPDGTAVLSLENSRLVSGPSWIGSDAFDIEARLPPRSTPRGRTLMMRALLEERFALKAHSEQRDIPIYALVREKSTGSLGERLRIRLDKCVQPTVRATSDPIQCGIRMRPGHFFGNDVSMAAVVTYLSQIVDRLVVDRTGLTGKYDFEVLYTPALGAGQTAEQRRVPDLSAPSIFAALQEQLGLKLEPTRASIDVVVIDDARRPSPN